MSENPIHIRDVQPDDVPACGAILYSLPDWFGLEESNRAFVESLYVCPGAVAVLGSDIVDFIALVRHDDLSYEISVMGVTVARHRQGIGSSLISWGERWCREHGVEWLHVKTRGPSTPDPAYQRTREFYVARGYQPLFESLTHWGPGNAALVLVKHLMCGDSVEKPEVPGRREDEESG